MVNPTRAKFLAAAVLKVAVLCLSLFLLVSGNSWAQPTPYTQVAPLIEKLTDNDFRVRHDAADAIVKIGSPAVPFLIEALKDESKQVRWRAASALGEIGAEASSAVSSLIATLHDEDEHIRRIAAYALGKIGPEASSAVPDLTAALQDADRNLRLVAAYALGKIGSEAKPAVPNLIAALQDTDAEVRLNAASALGRIGTAAKPAVPALIATLQDKDKYVRQSAADALGRIGLDTKSVVPALITALQDESKYVRLNAASALGRIGAAAKPAVPALICALQDEKVEVRRNAASGLGSIAGVFQDKAKTLSRSELEKDISDLEKALNGKTSLACQIAKWALSEDEAERLCEHQMLPVLIEEELDFEAAGDKQPFMAAIRGQLQDLANEIEPISQELLERLLRQRRILVIVDHLSEMSEATRKAIRPELPDFCVNALVITSRTEETLGKVTKRTLKPLRIEGNRLSSFMEAYLTQRGKRDRFTDTEFFDACSRLSAMVGARNITVLLAKLYAEQLIAVKDGTTLGASPGSPLQLPDNIPDLMLSYLNELNRDVSSDKFDDRTVQEDAKAIAWECLKQTYRPATAKRQDALAALVGDNVEARFKYLEDRLRLIQTIGPAQDQIRFALDPLAEYLAALQLLEHYGKNQGQWRKFLAQTAAIPGAPTAIQGFLLAVLDCCLAKGAEAKVPDFVAQELGKRAGLPAVTGQPQLIQHP